MSLIQSTISILIGVVLTYALFKFYETDLFRRFVPQRTVVEVPSKLKCALNEPSCDYNDLNLHTIIISLFFMLAGYYRPDSYGSALIISLGTQAVRYYFDGKSSFIIDPMANMTGYAIGSILANRFGGSYDQKYTVMIKSD